MLVLRSGSIAALLALCLCATGAFIYAVFAGQEDRAVTADSGSFATTQEYGGSLEEVERMDETRALLTFDPTDERWLVGESENVFFGWVVEQVGSEGIETSAGNTLPQTQFSVEVLEVIKGDVSGTLTVSQKGEREDDGHTDHKHERGVFEGDELLVSGEEYLFYTNYDKRRDWHQLSVPVTASHVKIDGKEKRLKEREEAKKAKANQVKVAPEITSPAEPPDIGRRSCLVEGEQKPPWHASLRPLGPPAPTARRGGIHSPLAQDGISSRPVQIAPNEFFKS